MRKGVTWTTLLAIVLLAFALRLEAIRGRDLWGDEAFSVSVMQLPLPELLRPGNDTHPPLFHLLMTGWIRAAALPLPLRNADPFPIRFGSLMLGMLTLPVVIALARRLAGARAALLAGLLVAASPLQVEYSGELRMYSLLALTSVLSVLAFVRLTEQPGRGAWLLYLGATFAAMCAHYNAFWVIAAENVVALTAAPWRGRRLRWIGGQALLALAFLPWVLVQAGFIVERGGSRGGYALAPDRVLSLAGQSLSSWIAGSAGLLPLLALVAALIVAGVGLWSVRRDRPWRAGLLVAWTGLTVLLVILMDPLMPFFHERFAIAGGAGFLILAACGLDRAARWKSAAGLVLSVLVLSGMFAGDARLFGPPPQGQIGYAGAMRAVAAESAPGDVILFSNAQQAALRDYYAPPDVRGVLLDPAVVNSPQTDPYLARAAGDAGRVWLVEYGDPVGFDSMRLVPAWLAERGFRQRFFSYDGGTVSLYVMGQDSAPLQPLEAVFGESIRLAGYVLVPAQARPGDVLRLSLRWEAIRTPPARYTVGSYILNEGGQLVAQTDAEPRGGTSPTDGWRAGDVVEDRYAVPLPPDLPPGMYTLAVGLYAWPDTSRIPVQGGAHVGNALILTRFAVAAPLAGS